ncbi:MAG: hypothetical protein Q8K82_22550 [Gemmatimonadaceae bacterium]|nr:hypothetical protein [Gemmatimonadaceae bacterium]
MSRIARILAGAAAVASLAVVLSPVPVLAAGGCTGISGYCKTVYFEVCAGGSCTMQWVDINGKPALF